MKNNIEKVRPLGAAAVEAIVVRDGNLLIQTSYDQQMFDLLVAVMKANPRNYAKTLRSKIFTRKNYKLNKMFVNISRQDLLSWIYTKTIKLNDNSFEYSLPTRCYWIITGRTDFPICPTCGNKFGMRKKF